MKSGENPLTLFSDFGVTDLQAINKKDALNIVSSVMKEIRADTEKGIACERLERDEDILHLFPILRLALYTEYAPEVIELFNHWFNNPKLSDEQYDGYIQIVFKIIPEALKEAEHSYIKKFYSRIIDFFNAVFTRDRKIISKETMEVCLSTPLKCITVVKNKKMLETEMEMGYTQLILNLFANFFMSSEVGNELANIIAVFKIHSKLNVQWKYLFQHAFDALLENNKRDYPLKVILIMKKVMCSSDIPTVMYASLASMAKISLDKKIDDKTLFIPTFPIQFFMRIFADWILPNDASDQTAIKECIWMLSDIISSSPPSEWDKIFIKYISALAADCSAELITTILANTAKILSTRPDLADGIIKPLIGAICFAQADEKDNIPISECITVLRSAYGYSHLGLPIIDANLVPKLVGKFTGAPLYSISPSILLAELTILADIGQMEQLKEIYQRIQSSFVNNRKVMKNSLFETAIMSLFMPELNRRGSDILFGLSEWMLGALSDSNDPTQAILFSFAILETTKGRKIPQELINKLLQIYEASLSGIHPKASIIVEIAKLAIEVPTITQKRANQILESAKEVSYYSTDDRIFAFADKGDDSLPTMICRGPYGISAFEIKPYQQKPPEVNEESIKKNVLRLEDIDMKRGCGPFKEVKEYEEGKVRSRPEEVLNLLGLVTSSMPVYILRNVSKPSTFDSYCETPVFHAHVVSISEGATEIPVKSESIPEFEKFMIDLGDSFEFAICKIEYGFHPEAPIRVVFANSRRMIRPAKGKGDQTTIIVLPLITAEGVPGYRVTLQPGKNGGIFPIPTESEVVVSGDQMRELIAACCIFSAAMIDKDTFESPLLNRITELYSMRLSAISDFIEGAEKELISLK